MSDAEKNLNKRFDVVGLGNAIVDILSYTDNEFLEKHNLHHGSMSLIEESDIEKLYKDMGAATECSGGSVANTVSGLAILGGRAAFIGRVSDDQFGSIFKHDLLSTGVHYSTPMADGGSSTARCLVFVTNKDKQNKNDKVERTMATYLGACIELDESDVDPEIIASSIVVHIEGYLWDQPNAVKAIEKTVRIAKENGTKIAFTLSDALLVGRHTEEFLKFIDDSVDILFANEREIGALLGEADSRRIIYRISSMCGTTIITRSEKGSYIIKGDSIHTIDPEIVNEVYDVTGAGDLYASGFLYGYVNGFSAEKSGRLGSLCAAEVIKFLGGRPLTKLSDLIEKI